MGGVLDRNGDGVHLMAIFHPEGVAMELEQIGTASPGFQNRLGQLNRLEVVKFDSSSVSLRTRKKSFQ